MTEIRHCEHSDWVVCEDCARRAALTRMTELDEEMGLYDDDALETLSPNVSEEDVEHVMKILDAAHCDIWIKLKPKTLRSMAVHVVAALRTRAQATDTPTQETTHGE